MNEKYSDKDELIYRYVKGKTTPEEAQEFEEYFIDKPELLEEIELNFILNEQLPKIQFDEKTEKRGFSLWHLLGVSVCSIAFSYIGILGVNGNLFSPTQVLGKNVVVPDMFNTRSYSVGEKEVKEIKLLENTQSVLLYFKAINLENGEHSLQFKDENNESLLIINDLFPTSSIEGTPGILTIIVNTDWLLDKVFTVEISAISKPEYKETILLKVTR